MSDELDDLTPFHESEYVSGQHAVRDEMEARRVKERLRAIASIGDLAGETLDQVEQLAKDGDPLKRKLAERLKATILGTSTRPSRAEQGRGPEQDDPFFEGSSQLATSLPDTSKTSVPPQSLEPPKPKRGRPPKLPQS